MCSLQRSCEGKGYFHQQQQKHSRQIRGNITSSISNIIYLIFIWTENFYGHGSTVNTKKLDTPAGQHFNLPNHSITYMILQGIDSLGAMWMRRLHTIHPHGINIQEGTD